MSANRDEILKELGLWPVWRLREPLAMDTTVEATIPGNAGAPTFEAPAGRAGTSRGLPRRPPSIADPASALPLDARAAEIAQMDWPQLKASVAGCTACPLHKGRNKTVFGVGDEQAEWLFIGEGPGADEDAKGEPFVGQAGKLLDNMLAAIGLKRGNNVYIGNMVKCLRYNALVQLGDGRWERIGRLVASKYPGDVMSVDESGALVHRRVTGWHSSPIAGRRVFRLSYASLKAVGVSKCGIQLTGDHPVLTERGWLAVQDLRKGDRIATGQGLSEAAFDLVCGTLLGDGHIPKGNAHLSMSHSARQEEYVRLKAELLSELGGVVSTLMVAARVGEERRYPTVRFRTRAHRALAIIHSQFYGVAKRVPKWMENGFTDRMLAFWFMDDGYTRIREGRQPRAEIATCAFSEDDLQLLLRALAKLGLFGKALRGRIHFGVDEARKLSERIAPFVPPGMRYKLHPDVANRVPFDPVRLRGGAVRVLYDEVEAVEVVHRGTDKTFFCLDVEDTHNFVTSGGVVHNCRPPGNRNPAPLEVAECEPHLHRQIALIRPRLIVALGKVAAVNLLKREASVASLRGKVLEYQGTPLIVTYHPAYLLRSLPAKAKAWEDLCFAVETMRDLQSRAAAPI